MSVRIPIITDFDGKGIARARKEFAQLDGTAARAKFALQKAAIPAAAAFATLAGATTIAVKAALEDQAAQEQLARTIKATTGATDKQIDANEDWITQQGRLYGFTDDDLRPALAKLVRVTGDVSKSQKVAALAMDISRGTGVELGTVTDSLTRALGGNMKSLQKLAPEMRGLIKDGATADEVMSTLAATFGGDASAYAETAAGKLETMKVRVSELKESLGAALLPVLENYVLPALQRFTSWAEENPGKLKAAIVVIGSLAGAVLLVNAAMAMNPWVLMVAGIALIILNLDKLKAKLLEVQEFFDKLFAPLQRLFGTGLETMTGEEVIRRAITKRKMQGRYTSGGGLAGGGDPYQVQGMSSSGGGLFGSLFPTGTSSTSSSQTINVNVSGGDPRAVVDAIVKWSRQNGALPPQIRTAG